MHNAYALVIVLFIAGGLGATVWGLMVIARARKTLRWPSVEGVIEVAELRSHVDDLMPHIGFRYAVDGETYRGLVEPPSGTTPTQELAARYREKYPAGARVRVYYDPQRPAHATLEPGAQRGDWLIVAFGLGAVVLGAAMLLMQG